MGANNSCIPNIGNRMKMNRMMIINDGFITIQR